MARTALASLPEKLRRPISGLVVRVEDFPDADVAADLELESPFDLLGLYKGVSLDQKSVLDVPQAIDMIFLYRRPILDYWCEHDVDLMHVVRHVLIHEIGHHYGLSDADMQAIEESYED